MASDEISRIERNGSTALHVASYNGHIDIVQLLLAHGADQTIKNKYQCTPSDEAATDEIKQLFNCSTRKDFAAEENKFIESESIKWIEIGQGVTHIAKENHNHLKKLLKKKSLQSLINTIENYVNKLDLPEDEYNRIKLLMDRALCEDYPVPLMSMYCAETSFYRNLNIDLARYGRVHTKENTISGAYAFTAIIAHHPKLKQYSYTGLTFRGCRLRENDAAVYVVDTLIMNCSFLSTSSDRAVAAHFSVMAGSSDMYLPTIVIYNIKHADTAIYLHTLSEYPEEREVLIPPFTVFKVTKVNRSVNEAEIYLDMCKRQ
ncbi:unnamed protein product [Didymodactylos carnosus]|uniref:NAD(P)(+)--arginine ADP-ribosyltransferase n=1 Tax=Didymodactylos carnosus TaxID=1234261 RepID=A0A814QWM3_9BILA|nr:unnamed protein product [Didymodactylos carnosus]CAF1167841.1 unnamed protein product [Didymodactylos carnosus]CAF3889140.1 unnamed protein product [Didymodactylos carnosus]CAF3979372.1 unnamed protein product [Didymodactylos carnosus]